MIFFTPSARIPPRCLILSPHWHLLIVHWGTFRLEDEPVHFPPIDLNRELEKEGISDRLVDLKHGQTLFYDDFTKPYIMRSA
ncbi:MAG: hypothetical protein U9R43_06485 [Thermodesulfobacteriota bacterium]|nr:hypothetical protein [Thermodesulfobacteriota bacterium]